MESKRGYLNQLHEQFQRWENWLQTLNEKQSVVTLPDSLWTVKDVLAHLYAWQQVSTARLEAAIKGKGPVFPAWLQGENPEDENLLDIYNERNFQMYHSQTWESVVFSWRDGFLNLIDLAEQIPETDLLQVGYYPWLPGYPLAAVFTGTCNHHQEHLDFLQHIFG